MFFWSLDKGQRWLSGRPFPGQNISQAVRFDLSAPVAGSYLRGTTEPRVRIAQAGDLWQRRHPVFLRREKANRDPATVRVPA